MLNFIKVVSNLTNEMSLDSFLDSYIPHWHDKNRKGHINHIAVKKDDHIGLVVTSSSHKEGFPQSYDVYWLNHEFHVSGMIYRRDDMETIKDHSLSYSYSNRVLENLIVLGFEIFGFRDEIELGEFLISEGNARKGREKTKEIK